MQSVSSKAVYNAFGSWEVVLDQSTDATHIYTIYGMKLGSHKILWFRFEQYKSNESFTQGGWFGELPTDWRPSNDLRTLVHGSYSNERRAVSVEIQTDGIIKLFFLGSPMSGTLSSIGGVWGDAYLFIS